MKNHSINNKSIEEKKIEFNTTTNLLERLKQKEKELKESVESLNSLIDNCPLAILLHDKEGKILRANVVAERLFQYQQSELISMNLFNFFSKGDLKLVKSYYKKGIHEEKSGRSNKCEALIKNKYNKWINIEITSGLLKIKGSSIIESYFIDVTERKNYEINQEVLLDQLVASLEFKSKFLNSISHELRTPLNAILGFSSILLEEIYGNELVEEQKDYLRDIISSSNNLIELIDIILDLSKIEAARLKLDVKKFKLLLILEEILSIIKPSCVKKGLDFKIIGIDENTYLKADPLRFKKILLNLINNAIKFTEKGSIMFRAIERTDHWEFQVEDTGIGIEKEDFEVVFREFERMENDSSKPVSGSGLGMTLTKRLIQLHGGDIWFNSMSGKGTTFYFTIPKNFIYK